MANHGNGPVGICSGTRLRPQGAPGRPCSRFAYLSQMACEDRDHARRVARLALALYDRLRILHGLGRGVRRLLEAAALLHDVGKVEARKAHHKASLRLILRCQDLPLGWRQRLVVGLVARYHRASPPKDSHKHFRDLHRPDRHIVRVLAGILRLADGLDSRCRDSLRSLTCKVGPRAILLSLRCRARRLPDARLPARRTALFEGVFDRPVLVRCHLAPARPRRARARGPATRAA